MNKKTVLIAGVVGVVGYLAWRAWKRKSDLSKFVAKNPQAALSIGSYSARMALAQQAVTPFASVNPAASYAAFGAQNLLTAKRIYESFKTTPKA